MNLPVFLLIIIGSVFFTKGCYGVQVDVEPREMLVLPGQNVTVMCRVAVPLQYCRIEIPGMEPFNLNTKLNHPRVSYYGSGLSAGQCGFTINGITDANNGEIRCMLGIETEFSEATGSTHLIVAKTPRPPEMDLSRGTDYLRVYKVNDELQASCIVRDGRPVANISWFMDDEPLNRDGLSMPTVIDMAKENLQSKLQNLTKILQPSDHGKHLKCVALHPSYPNGRSETQRQLDVKFAPIPQANLDKFGFVLGQPGVISVDIQANPKPRIEWDIGGERIGETDSDSTGRLASEQARATGSGRYLYNLRLATVKKEDTEKDYILRAYNDQGSQDYVIKIWTSPEPEGIHKLLRQTIYGVEMGLGGIIGIIVAVLFLLMVVFLLIFAKVTGRWCFSDPSPPLAVDAEAVVDSNRSRPRRFPWLVPNGLINIKKRNRKNDKTSEQIGGGRENPPAYYDALSSPSATATTTVVDELGDDDDDDDKIASGGNVDNKQDGDSTATVKIGEDGLVYAELDLIKNPTGKNNVSKDDDKTEYAEIVYTPPPHNESGGGDGKNDKK